MKGKRFYARGFWVEKNLDSWITTIMIIVHIGLGTSIIVGGTERFSRPSYTPLLTFTHGQIWIWGLWILISAMLMGIPFRWINIIGLWLGMVWHIVWMAAFLLALIQYDTAVSTAAPVYGGLAMICAALLTARIIDTSGG